VDSTKYCPIVSSVWIWCDSVYPSDKKLAETPRQSYRCRFYYKEHEECLIEAIAANLKAP